MNLLDRQMFRSYFKAYLICLISVLGLYIVIDLFTNIEDFVQNHSFSQFVIHIGTYYGYRSTLIFDRVSEAVALLAAMFTVAWMQRNNELLPLLSAGVSTQRVVRPVLFSACAVLGINVLNQELLIPRCANVLFRDREDAGDREIAGPWGYEPNGIQIEGRYGTRKDRCIHSCRLTIPGNICNGLRHLEAQNARYVPAGEGRHTGGWLLTQTEPAELDNWARPDLLEPLDSGKYFLKVQELDFETTCRPRNWFVAASTDQLYQEMCKPESLRLSAMAVLFHMRLTRPIMGMLLIFMGLSVILRDQNRNVFISAGLCLGVCALFFGVIFLCKHLGNHDYLPPALAAWLPVLGFGPMAFVFFDAVHT
jgi:lipopolysaccharide export system permease protein